MTKGEISDHGPTREARSDGPPHLVPLSDLSYLTYVVLTNSPVLCCPQMDRWSENGLAYQTPYATQTATLLGTK